MSDSASSSWFSNASDSAKARFLEVEGASVKRFIESQPDVIGSVELLDFSMLTSGAGASNGIGFLVAEIDLGPGRSVVEFVVRFDPGTSLLKQKSFSDEFETMRVAKDAGLPVPQAYWIDIDGRHLGRPGYIMQRVAGQTPSPDAFASGLFASVRPEEREAMILDVAFVHGRLRGAAITGDKVPHLMKRGSGSTAIEREFAWWMTEVEQGYATDARRKFLAEAVKWMVDHQPRSLTPSLVHGDAQFANHIFDKGRVVAMIDWELAFLGHNEADLGVLVGICETMRPSGAASEGIPTESELIEVFEEASGRPIEHWEYFKAMGTFKWCFGLSLFENPPNWDFYQAYLEDALKVAGRR